MSDSPASVSFFVPGQPQGKGRPRVGRVGTHARMFTPARTVAYEGLIAMAAQQAMDGAKPFSGPVALAIDAAYTVPASWSEKRRKAALGGWCVTKPDADNIAKSVGDGGNGVLWEDDKQIVQLTMRKVYAERPGLLVRVTAEVE